MWSILILIVLLVWSVIVVVQKVLPKSTAQLRRAVAQRYCVNHPRLLSWLMPKSATGCAGGCDCPANSDSSSKTQHHEAVQKPIATQPVQWR